MSPDQEDARITRRLREIDPARTSLDDGPPEFLRALATRLERERTVARQRRTRRRWRIGWAVSLASVIVAVAVALSLNLTVPPAEASTPTPLTFSAPAPAQEVIGDAIARLSRDDGVSAPERSVRMVAWGIVVEDGVIDDGPVIPQVVSLDWKADLSGHSRILKARTESNPGNEVGRVLPTDTVLSEQMFAVGEFSVPSAEAPAQTEAGVRELLTSVGMPPDPTPGDVVQAAVTAMELWTLSDTQHTELLKMIETSGKVESLGRSMDRLGREVLGLRVHTADGAATETVLISAANGRIVGQERMSAISADGIPAGIVIDYRMWDAEKEQG